MPALDAQSENRRQKDLARLARKKQKAEGKLHKLEEKHKAGKVAGTKYHAKKTLLKRQIAGFDREVRKLKGSIGKYNATK